MKDFVKWVAWRFSFESSCAGLYHVTGTWHECDRIGVGVLGVGLIDLDLVLELVLVLVIGSNRSQ